MSNHPVTLSNRAPQAFLTKFGTHVTAILSGFDRLRLRGTLRPLFHPATMEAYLRRVGVLLKDFRAYAQELTHSVIAAAEQLAQTAGRPFHYLASSRTRKEDLIERLLETNRPAEGLIAILQCVEPCLSYRMATRPLRLELEPRQCSHLYFYLLHPQWGRCHLRLQSWFPFSLDVCLNGRLWLARQLERWGLGYRQRDNCLVWVQDATRAQAALDAQRRADWPRLLQELVAYCHPLAQRIGQPLALQYYWSLSESEYATDLLFDTPEHLAQLYPRFVRHGLTSWSCTDILRFLGRRVPSSGTVPERLAEEVLSDLKSRPEGVRLKHRVGLNSLKLYDKQGSVLRVETTINRAEAFRIYRATSNHPAGPKAWRCLRRSVVDTPRRAEVSEAVNQRCLEALAATSGAQPLSQWAMSICRPVTQSGRRYRALNPWSAPDAALLEAVHRGEYLIQGFRNRDIRAHLYGAAASSEQERKRAGAISRRLKLLRVHGLIHKVAHEHRYRVSQQGHKLITALLAARAADVDKLTQLAA